MSHSLNLYRKLKVHDNSLFILKFSSFEKDSSVPVRRKVRELEQTELSSSWWIRQGFLTRGLVAGRHGFVWPEES
jgi:hypothetical protein